MGVKKKEKRNTATSKATVESKFKKQKREAVAACGELLAESEIVINKMTKKFNFWRNAAVIELVLILFMLVSMFKILNP